MEIEHEPFLSISNEFGHDSAIVGCFGCQVVPGKVAKDRSPSDQYLFSVSSDGHVQCWDSKVMNAFWSITLQQQYLGGSTIQRSVLVQFSRTMVQGRLLHGHQRRAYTLF